METIVSAIESSRVLERQRVGGFAQASKRQEAHVEHADVNQVKQEPDTGDVQRTAGRLNKALEASNRNLAISVHDDTGKMIVRVTDPTTGDVIRQIPPEQLLEAEVNINEIIGLFVNNSV